MLARPWTQVESSNLSELAHSGSDLLVRFRNGREYHYGSVPVEFFDQIVKGASSGRTFNELIKSSEVAYPCTRVA